MRNLEFICLIIFSLLFQRELGFILYYSLLPHPEEVVGHALLERIDFDLSTRFSAFDILFPCFPSIFSQYLQYIGR